MPIPSSRALVVRSSAYWVGTGQERALALFHAAARYVPAYKKFLVEHGVNHRRVRTMADFIQVPPITKANYLKKHPLCDLMWDGDIGSGSVVNRSSGSSGSPFYWLSNQQQRQEVSDFYDLVFTRMFGMHKKRTLLIVAYGMGSWVAGTTTLLSSLELMEKYKCTIVTPGYNRQEVIEICRDLGPQYEQVVIAGYPPLIKEIVDLGRHEGLDWPSLKPKFIFGAEPFSEEFRDYVLHKVGSTQLLLDSANTIGSADAMVIGHETPLSIGLRRLLRANNDLHDLVLGDGRMPTLAQYYPWQKHLEVVDGELHITSDGAMPLVRYNIQDSAKIFTYKDMQKLLRSHNYGGVQDALPPDMHYEYDWKLPFLLLYGKSNNALKFYGAIVYPENIKAALETSDMTALFTGKFKMEVYYDARQTQCLRLTLELAHGVKSGAIVVKDLQNTLVKTICALNREFRSSYNDQGRKMMPFIKLAPYGEFNLKLTHNKHRYA